MARFAVALVLTAALLLATLHVSCAADVTLPNGVTAVQIDQPTQGNADLGDKPTVTKPDEVFTGALQDGGTLNAGVDNGKPVASLTQGRKMLQSELQLAGNGVSAGNNDLGASANAYGHGQLAGLDDSHIEPHGVSTTVDTGGQSTTTGAAVNPDGVAKEGPVVEVGRK